MDETQIDNKNCHNERLQNILNNLSKCKINFTNESEECENLRETNTKLTTELKELRELEKTHRYHLITSREMIANLQETVSQLVYLKRDVKKLKDEIVSKDSIITSLEMEKDDIEKKHNDILKELRTVHDQEIKKLMKDTDSRVDQVQIESESQLAQITCVAEELRCRNKEMEIQHRDKMNAVVLDYEEKIQRQSSQATHLQEQLSWQTARHDANIEAYRKKLENLEEKLKQNQFKEYLAQNTSQNQSKVERPYSVERDPYSNASFSMKTNALYDSPHSQFSAQNQNKTNKQSTLEVMYCDGKPPKNSEKKGLFNITKKRKLYNEKDFLNN